MACPPARGRLKLFCGGAPALRGQLDDAVDVVAEACVRRAAIARREVGRGHVVVDYQFVRWQPDLSAGDGLRRRLKDQGLYRHQRPKAYFFRSEKRQFALPRVYVAVSVAHPILVP